MPWLLCCCCCCCYAWPCSYILHYSRPAIPSLLPRIHSRSTEQLIRCKKIDFRGSLAVASWQGGNCFPRNLSVYKKFRSFYIASLISELYEHLSAFWSAVSFCKQMYSMSIFHIISLLMHDSSNWKCLLPEICICLSENSNFLPPPQLLNPQRLWVFDRGRKCPGTEGNNVLVGWRSTADYCPRSKVLRLSPDRFLRIGLPRSIVTLLNNNEAEIHPDRCSRDARLWPHGQHFLRWFWQIRRNGSGRPGGCRANNLTSKNFMFTLYQFSRTWVDSSRIYAIRRQILMLKCTKFDFRWGSTPDPLAGFII